MIRKAQAADIPAVQTVARVAWEHTYKDIMKPATRSYFLDEFYNYDALAKALSVQPGGIWVAEQEGKIVGFIQVVPMLDRSGLELSRLYVLPEYQRQGVGQSLLHLVAAEYSASSWWALVERDDSSAVDFYRKNGFEQRRDLILNIFGEDLNFLEFFRA
ncbi:MAG: GNAT family N-acetyltransferase [Bacillota bacterium]|nr:GNAT family N-acetyltransferase [Bacillota bacterium]